MGVSPQSVVLLGYLLLLLGLSSHYSSWLYVEAKDGGEVAFLVVSTVATLLLAYGRLRT